MDAGDVFDKFPELKDAELDRIKAETELHRLRAEMEKIRLGDLERAETNELGRMKYFGEYLFYNPIVEQSVATAMVDLFSWHNRLPEGHPITVTFNSPGGYVTDGFTLYDFLRDLSSKGHPIVTKCLGIAASMGAILMQAGDERVITPNSFLMIHEIQGSDGEGSTSEREERLNISKQFQARGLNILAERSNLSKADISKRWTKKDWYIPADECLKLGLVDRIEGVMPKRRRRKAA